MTRDAVLGIDESTSLVERVEAQYFERFQISAPEDARRRLGIQSQPAGGGRAVAMRADKSNYWNKAMGFASPGSLTDAVVSETIDFFRRAGSETALFAAPPVALADDWESICARHGLTHSSSWAKLLCPIEKFRGGTSDLLVRPLEVDDAGAWGSLIRIVFGMLEPDLTPLLRAAITDPEASVFGAWDGEQLVGAGAVYCFGEVASLNTGGTLESHRHRGVQSALMTARAETARAAGCRWLAAETGSADLCNGSFRNLRRAGFEHLYSRPNWRWHAGQPTEDGD